MAYTTRIWIILSLVVSISLGSNILVCNSVDLLTIPHNSSHTGGGLSATLGQNLTFEYNETLLESSLPLSISNLNLSYFNEVQLIFIVNGDVSTKSGLSITFIIESVEIEIVIEQHYQDSTQYQLQKGFTLDEEISGNREITIEFKGQAAYSGTGNLTILSDTSFSELPILEITETQQNILVSPDNFIFQGEMLGSKEFRVLSALEYNYNDSYSFNFTISFLSNDFTSFGKELILLVNSTEQASFQFEEDEVTIIHSKISLEKGFNIFELIFQIDYSLDIIQISNLEFEGSVSEGTVREEVFYELNWMDGIDEVIDISSFKPTSNDPEQILNLSLALSFEGSSVYSGIALQIIQGSIILGSDVISMNRQTPEIQIINIETYTDAFNSGLYVKFLGKSMGSGKIFIYMSSSISVQNIEYISEQKYEKTLESHLEIQTSSYGTTLKNYYDVIHIDNASKLFNVNLSLSLLFSDLNFESLTVSFRVNHISAISQTISSPGEVKITDQITLAEGFNEIEILLSILGHGATVTIENLQYNIIQSSEEAQSGNPTEIVDIPFFKTPKSIAVGLFVLFDCWLLLGIVLRIYKGHKLRKRQLTENDEFILEIAQLTQDS